MLFAGLPLSTAFFTTIYAFLIVYQSGKSNQKIEYLIAGVSDTSIISVCLTVMLAGMFQNLLGSINSTFTAVSISLVIIPLQIIIPIIFLTSIILSIIIQCSITTTILYLPIAYGIARTLQVDSGAIAATVIGGVVCGQHLSIYHNKMIQILNIPSISIYKSIKKTLFLSIPAIIITLFFLSNVSVSSLNHQIIEAILKSLSLSDYINMVPYFLFLFFQLQGIHIIINLITGSFITMFIGVIQGKMLFFDIFANMFEGFYGQKYILKVVIFYVLMTILIKFLKYNHAFNYILDKLNPTKETSLFSMYLKLILTTIIINMIFTIELLSINFMSNQIKKINNYYNKSQSDLLNLFFTLTTLMLSILPYSPIISIATGMTHALYIQIIPYMIYHIIIINIMILHIILIYYKQNKNSIL
jgi:Na+/H+ antiporter NhaC